MAFGPLGPGARGDFDILASRGALQGGGSVLDAFAGSGALGIEALSRGAASVCFVESERRALAAIKANLVATGFDGAPEVVVVRSDVSAFLGETSTHYDLAFVDPPYAFGAWAALLAVLRCDLAVLESSRPVDVGASFGSSAGTATAVRSSRWSEPEGPTMMNPVPPRRTQIDRRLVPRLFRSVP